MSGNRSEENSICAKGINLHGSITVRFVLAAVFFVLSIVLQNIFHGNIVIVALLTVLYFAYLCIADVTLSRKLIGPLNQLMEMVHQLRLGHLNVHASIHSYTDLETFAHELNMTMDSLSRMIEQISGLLWSIAEKNLDIEPVENYPGDFVALSQALNTIIDNFNTLVYNITASSEEVASGSKQVAEGGQNLSNGATQQASSVEQLTASITEITKRIKQNAVNALKANQLAAAARESALLGARQMGEMLQAINEINDSTRHISKVIKVVNDIAFQINILALNAAVEAARAGQYGRGFVVVAKEVRILAARSANAVKETTDLIESSISKAGSGFKIANEMASVFSEIEKNVNSVATLVAEIALATREQDTGTAQISKGVEIVSNVVQTNSATAEQSAASSEELSSQAENLKELMDEFIIRALRC